MRLADNLDRHKTMDDFEFRQIELLTLQLFALECQKNTIFDLVQSIAFLVLIES